MSDLIDRQDAIDTLLTGKEFLMRVLDDTDVIGQDREKYSWGLGLIESCINDIEELPSAEKVQLSGEDATFDCISRQDAINALNACCVKYDISPNYDDKRTDKEKFYDWWDMHKVLSMRTINDLPSAEPEITHCKDCRNRGEDECPMRHVERIEWEEDGYIEVDDIVHDYTEPHGYCDKGERNE